MTTITVCDYPGCQHKATWKVEMTSLAWELPPDVLGQSRPRHEMDVCNDHIRDVSFDKDRIAEFDAYEASKKGQS